MKQIFLLAFTVLISYFSFAQKVYTTTKRGASVDKMDPYVALITITDTTVQIKDQSAVLNFKITKKTVIDKQNLFKLSDGSNDYQTELYINEEIGHMELTLGVERLEGFHVMNKKMYSLSKNTSVEQQSNQKLTRSLGGVFGYSTFMGEISATSVSYGGYVDFGYFGLEYHSSASLNTKSPDSYINGQTNKYVGGGGTMNIGFFSKFKPYEKGTLYMGLGAQSYTEISVENVTQTIPYSWYNPITRKYEMRTQNVTTPQVVEDKKVIPYFTIGTLQKLNDNFTFKAGLILSECSMINIGVGYNF